MLVQQLSILWFIVAVIISMTWLTLKAPVLLATFLVCGLLGSIVSATLGALLLLWFYNKWFKK